MGLQHLAGPKPIEDLVSKREIILRVILKKGSRVLDWFRSTWDGFQSVAIMNMILDLRVLRDAGHFLTQ
jgi:hypothetical protein